LYTEVSLGRNVRTITTRDELSHSVVPTSLWITVGISFGKFK
jgi:hypothetical protein